MTYATEFIKELQARKLNNFTHKDILRWTTANCSYSVLQTVIKRLEKDGYQIDWIPEKSKNNKPHRRYFMKATV